MIDCSFMAMIGPGSATATVKSGVPVAHMATDVAVAVAHA
jgi:hypothetical protein